MARFSGWFKKISGWLKYRWGVDKLCFGEISILEYVSNSICLNALKTSFFICPATVSLSKLESFRELFFVLPCVTAYCLGENQFQHDCIELRWNKFGDWYVKAMESCNIEEILVIILSFPWLLEEPFWEILVVQLRGFVFKILGKFWVEFCHQANM